MGNKTSSPAFVVGLARAGLHLWCELGCRGQKYTKLLPWAEVQIPLIASSQLPLVPKSTCCSLLKLVPKSTSLLQLTEAY